MNKSASELDKLFNINQAGMENLCRSQFLVWENLGKLQAEFANLWMEYLNAQLQRMSSAKNLNDVCATEAGLITEYSMKFSDNLRKVYETLWSSQKEFMECCTLPESMSRPVKPVKPEKAEKAKALEIDRDIPRSKPAS